MVHFIGRLSIAFSALQYHTKLLTIKLHLVVVIVIVIITNILIIIITIIIYNNNN